MEQRCADMELPIILGPYIRFYPDTKGLGGPDKIRLYFDDALDLIYFLQQFKFEEKTTDEEFVALIKKFSI
jgi:hypothetical protein